MGDHKFDANWNHDSLRLSTSELWAIITVAAERGIDVERCLMGTQLDLDTLCHRRARVSFAQQVEIQRRLALLLPDRLLAVHAGSRLHLTSFGIVGYALMACDNLSSALSLAGSYGPLLNMKHRVIVERRGAMAVLQLQPGFAFEDDVRDACEVLEVYKLVNLLRDMLGERFRPEEIRLARGVSEVSAEALQARLRCRVQSNAGVSEIVFAAELLDAQLPQSDSSTQQSCVEVCRHQIQELSRFERTAGRVRAMVEGCVDEPPSMAEVASKLCMSPRSLRRRLEDEGTSFHEIIDEIRRGIAERLLSTTSMKTEAIAERLGYGDAANFRHAFKRWTGSAPRKYREQHQERNLSTSSIGIRANPSLVPTTLLEGFIVGGRQLM